MFLYMDNPDFHRIIQLEDLYLINQNAQYEVYKELFISFFYPAYNLFISLS